MKYANCALDNINPLFDEIELFQCYTPETIFDASYIQRGGIRTVYEKCALSSHYELWLRLAEGEQFVILEHDVHIVDQRVLTSLLDLKLDLLVPGIGAEFVSMTRRMAIAAIEMASAKYGPLGTLRRAHGALTTLSNATDALIPCNDRLATVSATSDIVIPYCVTQVHDTHLGSTIPFRHNDTNLGLHPNFKHMRIL